MTDMIGKKEGPRGSVDLATENTVVQCDGFNAPDCTRAVISEFIHQATACGLSLIETEELERLRDTLTGIARQYTLDEIAERGIHPPEFMFAYDLFIDMARQALAPPPKRTNP